MTSVGQFVPFHDPPRSGPRSARVGWVVTENGCHIWQGARDAGGYGQAWVDGRAQLVHRVRYEIEVGPIPEGLVLDHFFCNMPQCCNPAHVRPVTPWENTLRGAGASARYTPRPQCPQGHPFVRANGRGHNCRTCLRLSMA